VDLFCGGLDVSLNVKSEKKICNDLEPHIIDFYTNIQKLSGAEVHNKLMEIVKEYGLSKENADGYNQLRKDYNANPDFLKFYSLIAHSFNHQLRYNGSGEFNMPFGKNRSNYNDKLQVRLQEFVDRIDESFVFINKDFRKLEFSVDNKDKCFVYCDPPYLGLYTNYFDTWDIENEKKLNLLLEEIKGPKIVSTWKNNGKIDNEIIEHLWQEWSIVLIKHKYNVGAKVENRRTITEALLYK
jgi:DNA adenine methylase Dam